MNERVVMRVMWYCSVAPFSCTQLKKINQRLEWELRRVKSVIYKNKRTCQCSWQCEHGQIQWDVQDLVEQAQWKQFRFGPVIIGSSVEGADTQGGVWACSPWKFWNLASLKCTFGTFSERISKKVNQKLRWKLHVCSSKLTFISVQ